MKGSLLLILTNGFPSHTHTSDDKTGGVFASIEGIMKYFLQISCSNKETHCQNSSLAVTLFDKSDLVTLLVPLTKFKATLGTEERLVVFSCVTLYPIVPLAVALVRVLSPRM